MFGPPARLLAALAVVVASGLTVCGCLNIFQKEFVPPKYDIRNNTVFPIAFREPKLWYGESDLGIELFRNIVFQLQQCDGVDAVEDKTVEKAVYDCLEPEDDFPWAEFGRSAGADMILMGTVHEIRYTEPGYVGMLRGYLHATIEVYHVATEEIAFTHRIQVTYPNDPETGNIEIGFTQNQPGVRRELFRLAGERIAAVLCGEEIDIR